MITREIIIDTSMALFLENGVKTITVDRIVQELHTSKRTIYKHFGDRRELLRACLAVYHSKVKTENEALISQAGNAIEAMGYLIQKIVSRSHQVNPNFFNDILHYYPGLLNESYRDTGNFAHQQLVEIANWGIEDKLFPADLDVAVVGKTVLAMLKLLKDTSQFPSTEFSKERLTLGILVPYLRGLSTPKGIKILEKELELYRVTI